MAKLVGAYDGRFGRLYSVASARRLVAHAHEEWQLIFNIKGPCAPFRIGRTPTTIAEGDVLAVPPWTSHSKAAGLSGPSWMMSVLIASDWLQEAQARGIVRADLPMAAWRCALGESARGLRDSLLAAAFVDERRRRFERDLAQLISLVSSDHAIGLDDERPPLPRKLDHRVRKALDIIRAARGRKLVLDHLAENVGLSRSHFFKLFKECVGASPLHAVDCVRIAETVRTLGLTNKPVAELARELGFSTQGHFTRFFVRHLFIPPAAYRERLRVERKALGR